MVEVIYLALQPPCTMDCDVSCRLYHLDNNGHIPPDCVHMVCWACEGARMRGPDAVALIANGSFNATFRVFYRPHGDTTGSKFSSAGVLMCSPSAVWDACPFGVKPGLFLCEGIIFIDDKWVKMRVSKILERLPLVLRQWHFERTVRAWRWSRMCWWQRVYVLANMLL